MSSAQLSRRAFAAGVACVPALTASAAIGAMPIGADQALFDIESKAQALGERWKIADEIRGRAEKVVNEWKRRNPEPHMRACCSSVEAQEIASKYGSLLTSGQMDVINMMVNCDIKAAMAEHAEASAEWRRRHELAQATCGFEKKDRARGRLSAAIDGLLCEAAEIQATTIAGVQCKARLLDEFNPHQEMLSASLVIDLVALQVA